MKRGRTVGRREAARLKKEAQPDPSLVSQSGILEGFRLPDGSVLITLGPAGGRLFTESEYREHQIQMAEEARNFSGHYLHGRELPADFPSRVLALIDACGEWCARRGQVLVVSLEGLKGLDEVCRRVRRTTCSKPPIFPMLVAVVGEVMCRAKNGRFVMRYVRDQRGVEFSEAWVRNDAGWEWDASFVVYKSMDEKVDLWTLTNLALRGPGWSPSRSMLKESEN